MAWTCSIVVACVRVSIQSIFTLEQILRTRVIVTDTGKHGAESNTGVEK